MWTEQEIDRAKQRGVVVEQDEVMEFKSRCEVEFMQGVGKSLQKHRLLNKPLFVNQVAHCAAKDKVSYKRRPVEPCIIRAFFYYTLPLSRNVFKLGNVRLERVPNLDQGEFIVTLEPKP